MPTNWNTPLGGEQSSNESRFRGHEYGPERSDESGNRSWTPSDEYGREARMYGQGGLESEGQQEYGWRNRFGRGGYGYGRTGGRWSEPRADQQGYGQFAPGSETGPYTGRGPKGYRRSDERIREDVCERLTQHGDVDASEVEVDVQNGDVTLRGSVDSRRTKWLIEDVLDTVSGVQDVHNHLRVNRGRSNTGDRLTRDEVQLRRSARDILNEGEGVADPERDFHMAPLASSNTGDVTDPAVEEQRRQR